MSVAGNIMDNNVLAAIAAKAPKAVVGAIKLASSKTGVDFAYLLQQAKAESSFDPAAKAKTSSASGLFQFIESTWMDMVKKHGDKYGIDSKASRSEILALRKDPEKASLLAAEFANENKQYMQRHLKGPIGATELYFAHFMGAGGGTAFLKELENNPMAPAADLFPRAAQANRGVFFDPQSGRPRTLQEVYSFFDKKFSVESAPQIAQIPPRKPVFVPANAKPEPETEVAQTVFNSPLRRAGSTYRPSQEVYLQANNNALYGAIFGQKPHAIPASLYSRLSMSPAQLLFLTQTDL